MGDYRKFKKYLKNNCKEFNGLLRYYKKVNVTFLDKEHHNFVVRFLQMYNNCTCKSSYNDYCQKETLVTLK